MDAKTLEGRDRFFSDSVANELEVARKKHASPVSVHQSYAIILEELDEFWEQVRLKRKKRDSTQMFIELVQVAAMAQRCATELLMEGKPTV